MDLPPDFRDLLEEFARESVECVLVGGYAVAFHARPRATKDIDLLLAGDPANLERAARALSTFGAPSVVVEAVRRLGEREVAFVGQPPLRIDLLRTVDGVDTAGILARAVPANFDGVAIRVISIADLIANKRAAGRAQDLLDVEILERVLRQGS